jgi:hypothetical protein
MTNKYLIPKAGAPLKEMQKRRGMFINPPAYPELGGFSGPGKLGKSINMALEKSPETRKGKPI